MKELKIEQSSLAMPAVDNKPESQHIAQEIKLLQFPHGNQTLLQNNQGMHKDAVTLNPDQLLELVRKSHYVLEPLRDVYLAEVTTAITEANELINSRITTAIDHHLVLLLQTEFDKNLAYVERAKCEFYGKRHESFLNEVKAVHESIMALFARPEAATDEGLLETFKALYKPMTFPIHSPEGLNPFLRFATPSRLQMYAEISVNATCPKTDEDKAE